ncbi:MAG TPA: extracellular solute-binding protein [Trebonia sp.]|nr:extracellular solute-binding protein [Trebonia sp.]
MKRHWRSAGLALAVVLPLAAAACSSSTGSTPSTGSTSAGSSASAVSAGSAASQLSPDQKVTITFESYNLSTLGAWQTTFHTLIAEFEKKYPNITVIAQKPGVSTGNGVTNAIQSLYNEVASGNAPDVAQETFGDMNFVVNELKADSLDQVVGTRAVQANFGGTFPFAPTARALGDLGGQTFAVPFVFSTPVLYYNASLFKAAGLNPADPPTTWAQVKADALAVKSKTGKDGAYIDCLTQVAGDWCYQALVDSNGGSLMSSNGSRLTFGDPAAVQAVAMAQDLVNSGAMPELTQLQAYPEFAAGKMGMILESSAVQGVFQKGAKSGNWQLADAQMPSYGGKATEPTNSGAALFMLSKNPVKQRAAWDLMTFLTSPQAFTLISEDIGYLPLRTGLMNDPDGLQAWAKSNPLFQVNLNQLAQIQQPWISFPGNDYKQIQNDMMNAVQAVVFQNANPAGTLAAAQKTASSLLPS